jgi:hypothetical protein
MLFFSALVLKSKYFQLFVQLRFLTTTPARNSQFKGLLGVRGNLGGAANSSFLISRGLPRERGSLLRVHKLKCC